MRLVLIVTLLLWMAGSLAPAAFADQAVSGQSRLSDINRLVSVGQFEDAATQLDEVHDQKDNQRTDADKAELARLLARTANGLKKSGDIDRAADLYLRAVKITEDVGASALQPNTRMVIHLAATSTLVQADRLAEALDCVRVVFPPSESDSEDRTAAEVGPAEISFEQHQMAVRLTLHVASVALESRQLQVARRAYALAAQHAEDRARSTALLGLAWTLATSGENPRQAARKLVEFVDAYPEHADAHRALRLSATCYRQASAEKEAAEAHARLFDQWPESVSATEVVRGYAEEPVDRVPTSVRQWLTKHAEQGKISSFDRSILSMGARLAIDVDHLEACDAFVQQLSLKDQTGTATSGLLEHLARSDLDAEAQRIATNLIAPDETVHISKASREAACLWAGRRQLWSMLALAAESSSPDVDESSRSVTVERLFAEALMQSNRVADAGRWWKHLVDVRGADDFATLLRCAESAVAMNAPDQAQQRIEAAREAAGDDGGRLSLVQMLAAELSIRRHDFDRARNTLESVIRGPETIALIRGRAQWLIGETYFLQHRFSDAIDAYRRVEGIDADGFWVPASLVQAGKSFEQLGRTREASVCYSTLIERFGDSSFADAARTRMAAMATDHSSVRPQLRR